MMICCDLVRLLDELNELKTQYKVVVVADGKGQSALAILGQRHATLAPD